MQTQYDGKERQERVSVDKHRAVYCQPAHEHLTTSPLVLPKEDVEGCRTDYLLANQIYMDLTPGLMKSGTAVLQRVQQGYQKGCNS